MDEENVCFGQPLIKLIYLYYFAILEANQLMEPEVIFKLSRIFAKINIIISNENVHDIPSERWASKI